MATPFISVVINNYNYARFLNEAIESVLNQDFPSEEFEVVIVDDGSTDNSREILRKYNNKRFQIVFQNNQGQAAAITLGIAKAKGEVICLLDSDDVWKPKKISTIASEFADPLVGGVQHHLEDVNATLAPLPRGPFPNWPIRYQLNDFLEGRCEWTATSGMAFRKSALKLTQPIPSGIFYYLDHFLAVGALCDFEIANVPKILGSHRSHGANWYFGAFADPRKLERESQNELAFWNEIEGWLKTKNKRVSLGFERKRKLETIRRNILSQSLEGHFAKAFGLWFKCWDEFWNVSSARFRIFTLFIAVLSPALYLRLYSLYEKRGFFNKRKSIPIA